MLGANDRRRDRGDPMTALKAARQGRRWPQARVLLELDRAAKRQGIALPSATSMKTQLSRWENDRRVPDELYRQLFREIYGMTDEQLGFVASQLEVVPAGPVPLALLGHFGVMLDQYAAADHLVGHGPFLVIAQEHATYLDRVARQAAGPTRAELLKLSARSAEFAGWLHQDAGDFMAATAWTDRAMECAVELADAQAMSYVLHRKSNIATDAGEAGRAIGLAEASLRQRDELTPRLRAVALRQQANALAMVGDREQCARSLGEAQAEAHAGAAATGEDVASYCTPAYVDMETGNCWLKLGEAAKAVPILERGLAEWPEGQDRDRGLCLSRLAAAHAHAGDLDAAAAAGLQALEVVRSASSARSLTELRHVRAMLAGSRTVEGANEFEATFVALTRKSVA
jgi:tetratricopeptide (TPR) repeat protein